MSERASTYTCRTMFRQDHRHDEPVNRKRFVASQCCSLKSIDIYCTVNYIT